jgi:OOP family OmpA-OmpF porin
MKANSMKKLAMSMAMVAVSITAAAQGPNIYFGLGTGFHSNQMKYSDLNETRFPTNENLNSGVLSLFAEIDFLPNHMLAVRPQFSYLRRGGTLKDIEKYEWTNTVKDCYYKLNSGFLDFRMPVLFQIGTDEFPVRPYVGVAPIVGFSTGGDIDMAIWGKNMAVAGYHLELNQANMASTYFAVAPMVGIKIHFPVRGLANACFLGLEASYEIGLTDTYGKEKDGDAVDVMGGAKYPLAGTRKFQGFELNATVGIPLHIAEKKVEPKPVAPAPVVVRPRPVVKKKACYTLEEIDDMINRRESVIGKTICAVDIINFDFNKATIKRESYPYLQRLAKTLTRTDAKVEVKGHTDNVGSDDYNMDLSRKRAKAVHDYLIRLGVNPNNLSYSYYGASQPLTDNDTEEGRTTNRRVEFEFKK